ncbi:uncharacterized protein LOC141904433 [Tubulanus polymorphus]|uniref:uncharacterized protein LOC141904433 n=1 Tax=Tubulanus polymorphus TaxID=672921 RepID=UPI003DA40F47
MASLSLDLKAITMTLQVPGYVGCYMDKSSARDLSGEVLISNDLTIEMCKIFCGSKGRRFAGLQFSNECYCGDSYGKYEKKPESECNKACVVEPRKKCGGVNRNSIYELLPDYLGCFIDDIDNRDLSVKYATTSKSMNLRKCLEFCQSSGYSYAGLQNNTKCQKVDCRCGNSYGKYGGITENNCDVPNAEDNEEKYGRVGFSSIYKVYPNYVGCYESKGGQNDICIYIGCYIDFSTDRDLLNEWETTTPMDTRKCLTECQTRGYVYAGLQYSEECFCGRSYGKHGGRRADTECGMKCAGNSDQICGDAYRNSIYLCSRDKMSVDKCINWCRGFSTNDFRYVYAKLSGGNRCTCATQSDSRRGSPATGKCTKPCDGDKNQICGGDGKHSIYKI